MTDTKSHYNRIAAREAIAKPQVVSESMVERVADAIFAAFQAGSPRDGARTVADLSPNFAEMYRKQARAAILAMREPTKAMSEAGCPLPDDSGAPYCYDRSVTDEAWRAMIDAALKDPA